LQNPHDNDSSVISIKPTHQNFLFLILVATIRIELRTSWIIA